MRTYHEISHNDREFWKDSQPETVKGDARGWQDPILGSRLEPLPPSNSRPRKSDEVADKGIFGSSFISAEQGWLQNHPVIRSPQELHPHPALIRLNLMHRLVEFDKTHGVDDRLLRGPILVTPNGIIISGFGAWNDALRDGRLRVNCTEYSLSDEQALEYTLIQHRPRRAWNRFTRVRLGLGLEPYFQRKALANQIAGGKLKGSANLPKAEHIEVREEIASVAGVGGRTVANVNTILKKAAPALIEALQDGTLTINRALQWCSLPEWKQVEQLTNYVEQRTTSKVICHAVNRSPGTSDRLDTSRVLQALQGYAVQAAGSLLVRASQRSRTVILLGQDLLSDPQFHTGLQTP